MPCGRGGMMDLNFKHWGLLACMLGLVGMSLSAKVERTTVYIFGFSASFTDSVAYITDVQQLDSAYIETKYDFLMDRVVYSDQLQTYLEAVKQMPNSTCTVFFHTKKNKLMEEYNKIRKRYGGDESVMLKELTEGGFKFQSPVYEPPVKVTPEPVESKATKKKRDGKLPRISRKNRNRWNTSIILRGICAGLFSAMQEMTAVCCLLFAIRERRRRQFVILPLGG